MESNRNNQLTKIDNNLLNEQKLDSYKALSSILQLFVLNPPPSGLFFILLISYLA